MKAVILAAGQGIRLKPLTNTRPKVMLQVAGKPILHHLLLELKKAGIGEAVIVVRYMKDRIVEYFKDLDLGMRISFVEQDERNGTAAALLAAEEKAGKEFVAVAGDIITNAQTITDVINAHKKGITLALKQIDNPHGYGTAQVSDGKIKSFEEKSPKPKSKLANLSVYCMDTSVFDQIKKLKPSARNEYEITDLLVGANAVITNNFWMDIGYPWHLFAANEYLLSHMEAQSDREIRGISRDLSKGQTEAVENCTINGKVIMEKGAKIFDSFIEGISYISEGSEIGPNACLRGFNSIGKHCEIGDSTTIKNSILFDNVKAKHLIYIGDSVIGDNVNFGAGTQIANFRFDESNVNVLTERGWVNSGRKKLGCVIGDNVKFGVLSCVMPGKLIGENCWIGSGAVVGQNVEPNTHVFIKQELIFAKEKKES